MYFIASIPAARPPSEGGKHFWVFRKKGEETKVCTFYGRGEFEVHLSKIYFENQTPENRPLCLARHHHQGLLLSLQASPLEEVLQDRPLSLLTMSTWRGPWIHSWIHGVLLAWDIFLGSPLRQAWIEPVGCHHLRACSILQPDGRITQRLQEYRHLHQPDDLELPGCTQAEHSLTELKIVTHLTRTPLLHDRSSGLML